MTGRLTRDRWIICMPPAGCGWYWQLRTVKPHLWSRRRTQARGPFWENETPRMSRRPESSGLPWRDYMTIADQYGDCTRHLTPVQLSEAVRLSRARNTSSMDLP